MKSQTVVEILDAAHLSAYVQCDFPERGGIMMVAPPGTLKTEMMKAALEEFPNALMLSDLNVNSLMAMRDDLISGRYSTIAFPELEKLYQRKSETSANIEGTIKALVSEGFSRASFEDQRAAGLTSRAFVVGAMTYSFYINSLVKWRESGFARRFLWCIFTTSDYYIIGDAIEQMQRLSLNSIPRRFPRGRKIPFALEAKEARWLRSLLRDQVSDQTPQSLLQKIYCVLKWKYEEEPAKPKQIMEDFAASLLKQGAVLELDRAPAKPAPKQAKKAKAGR